MKTVLISVLKVSVAVSLMMSMNACGSKDDKSDAKAVSSQCTGEGSSGYSSDGSNYSACSIKDGIGAQYASAQGVQGGTQIATNAVDFKTGEELYDVNTWTDDNFGKNDKAVSANVCRQKVQNAVKDSEGRSWGYENGQSCISL